jgi:lysine 2-monooxygenase
MASPILDVAVVGGGVSGAYSAWRLKEERPKWNIALFEYSKRIGGRLYTETLPGMPNVHAELGGMRYNEKDHVLVRNLVDVLKLPTVPFLMGDPRPAPGDPGGKPLGAANNLYYLRQKQIRLRDLTLPGQIPYAVSWNERGLNPDQIQAKVLDYLIPNHGDLTALQWFDVKVFGRELYKHGFWNLLFRVLTNEAYQFMKDAGGYDANVANANAVSQLPVGEFGPDVHFRTLRDGYQMLPVTLAERFETAAPGCVYMKHRLASIKWENGAYVLEFIPTKNKQLTNWCHAAAERMEDDPNGKPIRFRARRIILAMPRRSLELVAWEGWEKNGVRELRKSVLKQAALKLFLGYEKPWWRALDLYAGRSITDLPIRQVFYFGTESEQPGGNKANHSSLLMASYNDIGTVPFWKGTENDEPFLGHDNGFLRANEKPVPMGHMPATKGMVEFAQQQVREMHGQVNLPDPYTALYHDWSDDPYGGGWHEWKAGVKYYEVMPAIRKPVSSEDVYICGEAYSNNQGWVEGALQTAEKMLKDHFGVKWPGWLPTDYDLSW